MRRTRRIRRVVSGQANRRRQNAFACLCWLSSRTISPQPDHDLAGLLRSNLVPTQQIFLVLRCHRLLPAYGHTTGLPRAIELAILAGRGQKRAHSSIQAIALHWQGIESVDRHQIACSRRESRSLSLNRQTQPFTSTAYPLSRTPDTGQPMESSVACCIKCLQGPPQGWLCFAAFHIAASSWATTRIFASCFRCKCSLV